MKRQIPLAALAAASAQDIDHYLMSGKSILCSLGANKLRSRYTHLGLICKFALWAIMLFKPDRNGKLRRRAANVLRFFFPINKFETHYMNLDGRRHRVILFSHQSYFQIFVTIWYCLHYFPHCLYLFPVNITQYEVLVPCLNKMMELGVYLTPMITESTRKKLEAIAPENLPIINALARTLTDEYKTLEKTCAIDGNITAFDPLATRSSTIFSSYAAYAGRDKEAISKMPESISLIVTTLRHFKGEVDYIPVIATRKHPTGKGLNLFRPHDMFVGHQTSQAELLQKRRRYLKDRTAETPDYFIYRRLAAIVPDHAKYPH